MALSDPTFLYDLAAATLTAIVGYYDEHAQGEQVLPDRQYVTDGTPAWDADQVTVQAVRTFAVDGSGVEVGLLPLGPMVRRGAEFSVQVVRCIPTIEGDMDAAGAPKVEDIEGSARVILTDAEMMADAIVAAYHEGALPGCGGVFFAGWANLEPEGGLGGGVITVRMTLD